MTDNNTANNITNNITNKVTQTAEYRIATADDLEKLWNYNISKNPDEPEWKRWKTEYISYNKNGAAVTFAVILNGEPVGEGTLLLSRDCTAIRGRTALCDGKQTANINALRIRKLHEGGGHISKLVRTMEKYAKSQGYTRLTIGVEAAQSRNLAIYLHWGYTDFVMSETEDGELVLYYGKQL